MKLALCLYKYFPYGGLQRDFFRIALECQSRGHQICVYTLSWEGEIPAGFEVILIPKKGFSSQARNRYFYRYLQEHLQKKPVDLLVGFNKMPGLDVYYAADGCYEDKVTEKYGRLYRLGGRYKHFSHDESAVFVEDSKTEILMISDVQKPIFQHYYQTQDARMHMLPPGISTDRRASIDAAEIREEFRNTYQLMQDDNLLLMVGSGFKTKGVDRAIIGLASLPDDVRRKTQLMIIGQDKADLFLTQARRLGVEDRVHFLQGRDDVPRFLQGADLLIHPAYHENTGTVLLEALVAGLPVLVSGVCGYAKYVVEAKAGCVVGPPFSQQEFNRQLATMLLSEDKKVWRENALIFSDSADIYSMPQRAVDVIDSVLKKNQAKR